MYFAHISAISQPFWMIFFRVNPSDQVPYLHRSGCGSAFSHPGDDPCHCLCAWGSFSECYLLVADAPEGTQAAIFDVDTAFRNIPTHPSARPFLAIMIKNCIHLDHVLNSDVPAPAWPESPGFGLALLGLGFVKWEAKPKAKKSAWLCLALA